METHSSIPTFQQVDEAYARYCAIANHPPLHDSDVYREKWEAERRAARAEHFRLKGLMFDTPEKRICWTAHLWNRSYGVRVDELKAMGFSDAEISEGCKLGAARSEEYLMNCYTHGDPAYGAWGVHSEAPKQPHQDRINAALKDHHR
jgi:hypothetical protein